MNVKDEAHRLARVYTRFEHPLSAESYWAYEDFRKYCLKAGLNHREVLQTVRRETWVRVWGMSG